MNHDPICTLSSDDEVIIFYHSNRDKIIEEYFTQGGREIDDYDENMGSVHLISTRSIRAEVHTR